VADQSKSGEGCLEACDPQQQIHLALRGKRQQARRRAVQQRKEHTVVERQIGVEIAHADRLACNVAVRL
jgi:hypothetical protein